MVTADLDFMDSVGYLTGGAISIAKDKTFRNVETDSTHCATFPLQE